MQEQSNIHTIKESDLTKNKGKWKNKLIFILFLTIVIGSISFWVYFRQTKEKLEQAEIIINKVNILSQETKRCAEILSETGGTFSEYEYCKKLLQTFK